jgi:hypothetical protein
VTVTTLRHFVDSVASTSTGSTGFRRSWDSICFRSAPIRGSGRKRFTVTNLILADPDPKLFELPEGFTVIDERQTAPPEN